MTNENSPPVPALSDAEIQDRVARGLDRGAATVLEALLRSAGVLGLKIRALEREIERTQQRPGVVGSQRLGTLMARLEGYRKDATAAAVEAGLARARGGLATFPAQRAEAFGRVTDAAQRAYEGVSIAVVAADGKVVAKTHTDADGYFSIRAPAEVEGELTLQVATEPARTFRLSHQGHPLPPRRILIETATRPPIPNKASPKPQTEAKAKAKASASTKKPTKPTKR